MSDDITKSSSHPEIDDLPHLVSYVSWFGEEIGRLAAAADWPLPNSNGGPCPVGERKNANKAPQDENNYLCYGSTCPTCNFCFKWHHPKGRHGSAREI